MDYKTDITVIVTNGKDESEHVFENELVSISRATKLYIKNISGKESDFYETIKMWNKMDKDTKLTSFYTIKTGVPTLVQSFRKYYVEKINEDNQSITFAWY